MSDREGDPGRRLLLGHAGPDPQAARRDLDPGRLHRRRRAQRHLPQPRHGHAEAIEIIFDPAQIVLPGPAGVLLPDPRPDDEEPAGQRHRHELPLGDLLHQRRAEAGRRGHHRRRRRVRPVAGQGRHRGDAGRAVLGGRARAPGLPRAATRTATPATSSARAGSCRAARSRRPAKRRTRPNRRRPGLPGRRRRMSPCWSPPPGRAGRAARCRPGSAGRRRTARPSPRSAAAS